MSTTVTVRYILSSLQNDSSALVSALAQYTVNNVVVNQGGMMGMDTNNNIVDNYHLLIFFYTAANESNIRAAVTANTQNFVVPIQTWAMPSVTLG